MIVLIPSPEPTCPALDALRMEGVSDLHLALCQEPTDYGRYLSEYWNRSAPFIVCEWDIVPWPGAIDDLATHRCDWGTFPYALHRGNVARGFGIGKYVPKGPAPAEWKTTEWRMLDGQVIPHLRRLYGTSCVHRPGVAHARRELAA